MEGNLKIADTYALHRSVCYSQLSTKERFCRTLLHNRSILKQILLVVSIVMQLSVPAHKVLGIGNRELKYLIKNLLL